jgi:hypothetical protein
VVDRCVEFVDHTKATTLGLASDVQTEVTRK